MGFYKTTQKAALDAWDNEINQRIALREKADVFAKNSAVSQYCALALQTIDFTA